SPEELGRSRLTSGLRTSGLRTLGLTSLQDSPMRATTAIAAIVAVLTACSGGDDSRTEVSTVRDSAGVSIVEISAQGWASAPSWRLASAPIAVIGGEVDDGSVDLSHSQPGPLLPAGRGVALSMQPVQPYPVAPYGLRARRL